ncbi:cysteine and histidine-rich domain-containing protein [Chelonus insularis]|uniref:cysteine and histidine-rich domain-containing protein n=1 Tax=Chelonus insularis TaxID=460826 RepID=UPI00158EA3F5|nr:cysteine and histidine-rich domain-containing protein [Chelonus insularis]
MSNERGLLLCYNRGCGKEFDPDNNEPDACVHHPGAPIFHDAYKGWSCCNKKCTDFTEFLNIKGCTKSYHTNQKPVEPEKPPVDKSKVDEVIEYRAPVHNVPAMKRPPFETPQIIMTPVVSSTLLEQIKGLIANEPSTEDKSIVKIGESCKNKPCKASYQGPQSDSETCTYHPGVPIFHEGLKFWSCCQKKTTDFGVFLDQPGCTQGTHLWLVKNQGKKIECRMDWHQTGSFVVVSIYAKKYNPNKSSVKLNPIRLTVDLFFPEEDSSYLMDVELRGIIDVDKSSVNMLPTKVEIKLRKAELGSWSKLDFPGEVTANTKNAQEKDDKDAVADRIDAVDLNDL